MRGVSLHLRNDVFYVQFRDPQTGKRLSARSTGKKNRDEALMAVSGWLRDGIPTQAADKPKMPIADVFELSRVTDSLRRATTIPADAVQKIIDILVEKGCIASASLLNTPGSELFNDFLMRFWDYDTSPYVQEKVAHGQMIGRSTLQQVTGSSEQALVASLRRQGTVRVDS